MKQPPFVIALTGASGSIYGVRLVQVLVEKDIPVVMLVSKAARRVMEEELGVKRDENFLAKLFGPTASEKIDYYPEDDIAAPCASGSFKTKGMVVIPCAMGFVGAAASGVSRNLLERTADVMLKEGRPLILVPRDMPWSLIHLENLTRLAHAGAKIIPAAPGFYHHPQTIQDMIDFVVGKVLDVMGVEHNIFKRWKGDHYALSMERE
jgi:4-hydroxy-3-polyprenylbenzoate decarboxylase